MNKSLLITQGLPLKRVHLSACSDATDVTRLSAQGQSSVTITSLNYPQNYNQSAFTVWKVVADASLQLAIHDMQVGGQVPSHKWPHIGLDLSADWMDLFMFS